jgi:DNA protecting protein DprA
VFAQRDLEAAHALLLLDAPGVGPRKCLQLLHRHGSAQEAFDYLRIAADAVPERIRNFTRTTPLDSYIECVERNRLLGGQYKLWSDVGYPASLSQWDGRPPVLFYKGDLSHLNKRSLALVGRVDPTDKGFAAADWFARKCVDNDITVVSGLAKGIDGASHRASLREPKGYTYAVVGHGLDYVYPRENCDLYDAIPLRGAVISQFSTGTGPQRWTFPARNEVMCTLALGTVIVEGKPGCGSIIQADFSFKHGRPVFLLRRNLGSVESGWAEELVARGAHVVECFDQVIEVVDTAMNEWSDRGDIKQRLCEQPFLFD